MKQRYKTAEAWQVNIGDAETNETSSNKVCPFTHSHTLSLCRKPHKRQYTLDLIFVCVQVSTTRSSLSLSSILHILVYPCTHSGNPHSHFLLWLSWLLFLPPLLCMAARDSIPSSLFLILILLLLLLKKGSKVRSVARSLIFPFSSFSLSDAKGRQKLLPLPLAASLPERIGQGGAAIQFSERNLKYARYMRGFC